MGEGTRASRVVVTIGGGVWSPDLFGPKERRDRLFSGSKSNESSGGDWENWDSS